jgi:hypothetical protein
VVAGLEAGDLSAKGKGLLVCHTEYIDKPTNLGDWLLFQKLFS